MKSSNTITSLPPSPTDDRHGRMLKYTVAMGIRVVCLVLCFVFPLGWWTLLPILGAVFIPYYAVVLANVGHEQGGAVEAPGGVVELYRGAAEPAPEAPFRPRVVPDDVGPRSTDDPSPTAHDDGHGWPDDRDGRADGGAA